MNGDIKKVAVCKVKPYELVDRRENEDKNDKVSKKVMLEDGLEDVENLMDPEDKLKEALLEDEAKDKIGVCHLFRRKTILRIPFEMNVPPR